MNEGNQDRTYDIRERLARIEEQIKALKCVFDEAIMTQIKDHGKRISALENFEQRRVGGRAAIAWLMAACSAVGGLIATVLTKIM